MVDRVNSNMDTASLQATQQVDSHVDFQQIDGAIEQLLARWTLGSDAPLTLQDCPDLWQDSLAKQDNQELPLATLALLSQYQALMQPAQATTALTQLPKMPVLDYPELPKHLYKYLTAILGYDEAFFYPLLALLAQRGYVVSPITWLQYRHQNPVSEQHKIEIEHQVYGAWYRWYEQRKQVLQNSDVLIDDGGQELTVQTWSDFLPAERLLLLTELRQQNPDACRELMADCIGQEPADKRLKIIEVLKINLSENDLPFLQQLQQDRSKKVLALVNQLLARLGQTVSDDEDLQELTQMLEVKHQSELTNVLSKSLGKKQLPEYCILPKTLKTSQKCLRRLELLETVNLVQLAQALSLSVEQLLVGWVFNKFKEINEWRAFLNNVANLPDDYLPAIYRLLSELEFLTTDKAYVLSDTIQGLWQRLTDEQRQQIFLTAIKSPKETIAQSMLFTYCAKPISEQSLSWREFQNSYFWKKSLNIDDIFSKDKLKKGQSEISSEDIHNYIEYECLVLGLLLPASLAEKLLDYLLTKTGFMKIDPIFSSLLLNIELDKLKTCS